MATIKTRIKKAFKNETLEEIRAWNMDSGQVFFFYQVSDLFVIEGEMGRKAFKTYNGAFNRFAKISKGLDLEFHTSDDILDIDTFQAIQMEEK